MKILITSALPYVNNVPHLGNIIGCVLSADVFARYCRSRGYDCIYVGGTDEYGTATEIKALEEGVTPKEICDKYYAIHKGIYDWLGISFDIFGRTSTEKHTKLTQEIFLALHRNGHIVEDEVEQLYDEKAGMFLADRYIEGECPHCSYLGARGDQCDKCGKLLHPGELINPLSKVTKTKPVARKTKHLFINLPGIEAELEKWVDSASVKGEWSENTTKIARSWLREGLKKRCITRDLKWGVPVPLAGYESKVFYVWFEAPIGYISITANLTEAWKEWWLGATDLDVRLYNFIGKDNVPFHAVIFPSTLMGTKQPWTLVHHISTTEFLNYEGGKFSKSRNTGVFGDDALNSGIAPDVWRYYLLSNRPESADTDFTWGDFSDKSNSELLANLGNLVNRTLVFMKNNFGGAVPDADAMNDADKAFLAQQDALVREITSDLEKVKIRDGIHRIMSLSKHANKYFQDNKPWELVRATDKPELDAGNRTRAAAVMSVLVRQVRDLAILVEPYLPFTGAEIFRQLNLPQAKWGDTGKPLPVGHKLGEPKALFRKIEPKEIDALKAKFAGKGGEQTFTFADLDLEVGEIQSVEKHPDAEKLFVEKVRLGDGIRQIVSGLAGHYLEEELVGKKVVIVKNLAPAKLRGVESAGMLLAAEGREHVPQKVGKGAGLEQDAVEVVFCPQSQVGQKVLRKGEKSGPKKTITFKEFGKVKIEIKDFAVVCDGKPLATIGEELRVKNIREGVVG
ncbi:methionine--tRNA ligase [Candidatus Micrarchaeota archaeon]|nr:methionine--tRNA ligase [Candidatus Micrarchaeota archaeon]